MAGAEDRGGRLRTSAAGFAIRDVSRHGEHLLHAENMWSRMVSKRAINQALGGFLGTYTSRYSAYDGYWLFGFLVGHERLEIDLQHRLSALPTGSAVEVADDVARERFKEQLDKAGIAMDELLVATLRLETLGEIAGLVAGRPGRRMRCRVVVTLKGGRVVEKEARMNVAVHDPRYERQTLRS